MLPSSKTTAVAVKVGAGVGVGLRFAIEERIPSSGNPEAASITVTWMGASADT